MQDQIYLSEEGYTQLKKQLEERKTKLRKEISERIEEAKKLGDLSENSEYMEAKEAQEANERKVVELKVLLRNAVVISKHRKKGVVQVGSTVTVRAGDKITDFIIVGSEEANPTLGKISNLSPLGSSFLSKKVGDVAEVRTPSGVVRYEIVDIK